MKLRIVRIALPCTMRRSHLEAGLRTAHSSPSAMINSMIGDENELLEGMADETDPEMAAALESAAMWMGPGVEGVGQGVTDDGKPCIVVFVSELDPQVRAKLPTLHHGFPVVLRETGVFQAE